MDRIVLELLSYPLVKCLRNNTKVCTFPRSIGHELFSYRQACLHDFDAPYVDPAMCPGLLLAYLF